MPLENVALLAFNRGLVSNLALARLDLDRMALSAETYYNWMPRVLGSAMLRPGLGYIGATDGNNTAVFIPFIFKTDDTALLELTDQKMRVWTSDALVSRVAVTTAITNGTFDSNLSDWTDADESGATSSWLTGGYMSLVGTNFNAAIRRQLVSVPSGEGNTAHALRVIVERGPCTILVGSTAGGAEYFEYDLKTGEHSLAFTPSGDFYVEFQARSEYAALIDSVAVEAEGTLEISAPWLEADLPEVRYDQSGDVIFVASDGYMQRRIERRSNNSWSIVEYKPEDGPFRTINTSTITLAPSALTGDITLTASRALFASQHVGSLFRITSIGQTVEQDVTAENQFTGHIRVTGVGASRLFDITIAGTFTATVTLQRSVGSPGSWADVGTYSSTTTYNDGLDNQIIYYRIGVKTGDYTSGTAELSLTYASGGLTGIVCITAVASSRSASAQVLVDLGGTDASSDWSEGEWSDYRGYPTAVNIYEGRLWWAGGDKVIGSVSDAFESFDDEIEGDSQPISRAIGKGPVAVINWLVGAMRLLIGAQGAEWVARSSNFDDPLTATNFNLKDPSTEGSKAIAAVKVDSSAFFVQRNGRRLYELGWRGERNDYGAKDISAIVPEIGNAGFIRLAVQRQPDTRIHCVRSDGTVAVLVFQDDEEVVCWVEVTTDGIVEDVVVLPGTNEDAVYYVVNRTINGATKRYLERWAEEGEVGDLTLNKQADSFVTFTNSPASNVITGLSHLEGESVIVWADGVCLADANGDIATFTVSSGRISVTNAGVAYAATTGVVGLPYKARLKSTKLAYAAGMGSALTQKKSIGHLGVILADTHARGLKYGPDFTTMDDLPMMEEGALVDPDTIHSSYDNEPFEFPGEWDTDARLCLEANAPRPCTLLAAVMTISTHDKS